VFEVFVVDVAAEVVVIVKVTAMEVLYVVELVELLAALVEVELIEIAVVAMLEVDDVLLVVESRREDVPALEYEAVRLLDLDVEDNIEAVAVPDDVLFVCVCARATGPELNDQSKARRAIAMRIQMLMFLPKRTPFAPNFYVSS
jgi:hypothetical protein